MPKRRVQSVLAPSERCRRYVRLARVKPGDVDLTEMAEDAIGRNVQVIGEAAKHLPPHIIAAHPEVPWPQIRGFRNILVHQYFGVDVDLVRDVVEQHLPVLESALAQTRDAIER